MVDKIKEKGRYKDLSTADLNELQGIFSKEMMAFITRNDKVDVWRLKILSKAIHSGALLGLDRKEIRSAIIYWMRNPTPTMLKNAYLDLVIKGTNVSPAAKDSGLDAKGVLRLQSDLQLFTSDPSVYLKNPETFKTIRKLGAKKGMDAIYKKVLADKHGLPAEALKGRTAKQILKVMGDVQKSKKEVNLKDSEFWKSVPKPKVALRKKTKRRRSNRIKKTKPKNVIVLDPITITARKLNSRKIKRDEIAVFADDDKNIPWIVRRYYEDGSEELLTYDGEGLLQACPAFYDKREDIAKPIIFRGHSCYRVPSNGGGKRTPGVVGIKN